MATSNSVASYDRKLLMRLAFDEVRSFKFLQKKWIKDDVLLEIIDLKVNDDFVMKKADLNNFIGRHMKHIHNNLKCQNPEGFFHHKRRFKDPKSNYTAYYFCPPQEIPDCALPDIIHDVLICEMPSKWRHHHKINTSTNNVRNRLRSAFKKQSNKQNDLKPGDDSTSDTGTNSFLSTDNPTPFKGLYKPLVLAQKNKSKSTSFTSDSSCASDSSMAESEPFPISTVKCTSKSSLSSLDSTPVRKKPREEDPPKDQSQTTNEDSETVLMIESPIKDSLGIQTVMVE